MTMQISTITFNNIIIFVRHNSRAFLSFALDAFPFYVICVEIALYLHKYKTRNYTSFDYPWKIQMK